MTRSREREFAAGWTRFPKSLVKFTGTVFAVTLGMRIALFASLLLAFACGGDDGLTVSGQVAVDADGTPTGFDFVETTKLVDLTHEEDSRTVMAGSCFVEEGSLNDVTVVLQAPGEAPEGVGLHRFEATIPFEGTRGYASARLGSDVYEATLEEACSWEVVYRDGGDRAIGLELDCELTGPGAASAGVQAELHFTGCTVGTTEE